MKLPALILSILLFVNLNLQAAEPKIPGALQGYWLFDAGVKGNWDEILIGENYVEFMWDLYKVERIREDAGKYELSLSSKYKGLLSLSISLTADSVADFSFSRLNTSITARLRTSHPDVVYYRPPEIQQKLSGQWYVENDTTQKFKVNNNQMTLYGGNYQVVWFGEYLKREYRALVREGESYRLVYFKKRGPMINIGGDGQDANYVKAPKNPAVLKVLGNWYEPLANNWTFGFFEEFAVYNGKFWNYDKLSFTGNTGAAVLTNGKSKLSLTLKKSGDSSLSIKLPNKKAITYRLAENRLPAYATKDHSTFKNTHFLTADTAYITGYLRNMPNQQPFSVSFRNLLNDGQETVYGEIDSLGRFTVKVPIFNTTQVFLDWGRLFKMDILSPNEHYLLYYDFASKQYLMMGDNARFHNELSWYNSYDAFPMKQEDYDNLNKLKGLDYLKVQRERLHKANNYTSTYLQKNPSLSDRFVYFVNNFNRYNIARDLMQKRFDLDRQKVERFPAEYMEFVTDSLFNNSVAPFTLTSDYSTFIRDYVDYVKEGSEKQNSVSHSMVLVNMIDAGTIKATEGEKEAAKLEWAVDSLRTTDSLQAAHIMKKITPEQHKLSGDLRSRYGTELSKAANDLLWMQIFLTEAQFYQDLITDEDVLKPNLAKVLYQYLERMRRPMDPKVFNVYINKIGSKGLGSLVLKYQNHLINLPSTDFTFAASLKNTDHLKESKDADSLLKALFAPYKGKVIYLDFWGTWCGPCRDEMNFVGAAKEALKGKDVIFMYFANNSPEETWKNMIKDLKLTSQNTVHYRLPDIQQALIERRLAIKGFPTYMLVDKDGNISNAAAPRPSQKEQLVSTINGMLN